MSVDANESVDWQFDDDRAVLPKINSNACAHPAASERDARSLQDAVPFEAAVACAIGSGIERSRRAARLGRRRSAGQAAG